MNHLIMGRIEKRHNKWYTTTKLMDLGEKGKIHSNIPSIKTLKVVNISSEQIIGATSY